MLDFIWVSPCLSYPLMEIRSPFDQHGTYLSYACTISTLHPLVFISQFSIAFSGLKSIFTNTHTHTHTHQDDKENRNLIGLFERV